MPVNLISEEKLRLALNSYRVDPEKFETAVRKRAKENAGREYDPLATMSPLLKSAAGLLPLEVLTAGRVPRTAVESAPVVGVLSKLLGYAAFPAISLFVLLGSAIFGAASIRKIQNENSSAPGSGAMDEHALRASAKRWWHDHRRGGWLLSGATIALAWFGATWLMFLGYIVSTLILLYLLKSFASFGIGNRLIVGQSCALGLLLLGQTAGFAGIGAEDIHLIDQALLVPVFFVGALVVSLVSTGRLPGSDYWRRKGGIIRLVPVFLLIVVSAWFMNPILRPATPARIRAYVESFDRAEFSSVSWRHWEIVANWAVKSEPAPDLSRPRRLLAEEIADQQNPELPMILGSAFHAGLAQVDQISQLTDYERSLRALLDQPVSVPLTPLDFKEWVIRAAILRNDLTPEQRDYLAERLHATLGSFLARKTRGLQTLREPLLATQLLEVLGRPVDPPQYQKDIHALLNRFHSKTGGGFQRAGGFRVYDVENLRVAELNATSDAVELMEVYGIPKDLDMNWVRSFLRPSAFGFAPQKWITAVTLDRLNQLPGITRPSWLEILYYERSFLAAVILIGLCIHATRISPNPIGVLSTTSK